VSEWHGVGHGLHDENPTRFTIEVKEFMTSCGIE